MEIEIELTREPIAGSVPLPIGAHGAWLEFRGVVRNRENGREISALEYEAYPQMAVREIRRLLEELSSLHSCMTAKIIHRVGVIPAGETAIYAGVASAHRGQAIALLAEFMDRLKQDVPIWKRRAIPIASDESTSGKVPAGKQIINPNGAESGRWERGSHITPQTLDGAIAEISSRCAPLPAVYAALDECPSRVLRETVRASADSPDCDRSTRDGYAILQNDSSEIFKIVDTLHAADCRPMQMENGQTVRVATGTALPCPHLRVVMQENVESLGDKIRITKPDRESNVRRRGEDVMAGTPLVSDGVRLDAGTLALLASTGCVTPFVSPRLRAVHFTTGDEIVPPEQTPRPGQVRDINSILIRGLLQKFSCNVSQSHLPEDFNSAREIVQTRKTEIESANVVLVSGGASVGEKDFTRPLLEWLGFKIVFSHVAIRPGRPLIFAMDGPRVAFGLPGNPLSHFVCFHLFVATALARLLGEKRGRWERGHLASALIEAPNPRETLWPARLGFAEGQIRLHPLKWSSSGDVTCLGQADALIRVEPNRGAIDAGAAVDFLRLNLVAQASSPL